MLAFLQPFALELRERPQHVSNHGAFAGPSNAMASSVGLKSAETKSAHSRLSHTPPERIVLGAGDCYEAPDLYCSVLYCRAQSWCGRVVVFTPAQVLSAVPTPSMQAGGHRNDITSIDSIHNPRAGDANSAHVRGEVGQKRTAHKVMNAGECVCLCVPEPLPVPVRITRAYFRREGVS